MSERRRIQLLALIPYALLCTVAAAVVARVGAAVLAPGLPFSRDGIVAFLSVALLLAAGWYAEAATEAVADHWQKRVGRR